MSNVFEPDSIEAAPPVAVLGVPFDPVTMSEALGTIGRMVASRRPHYVVTANVDFLVQARADVELRRILLDAHLVLCDGTPVLWASRLLGNPLPERVAGADLVPRLIRIAADQKLRLFFLGGTNESMSRALANVKAAHPNLIVEGYSPPFHPLLEMDHDEIKRRITDARPDMLFVSFGCPKQEKWIAMHYQSLGVPVAIGVGGTIDFLAGQLKRAPTWMQRTGTEWLFRLAQEPRRLFRRYAHDLGGFGWLLLAQWFAMRLRGVFYRTGKQHQTASHPGSQRVHARPAQKSLKGSFLKHDDCKPRRFAVRGFVPRLTTWNGSRRNDELSLRLKSGADFQWIQIPPRLDAETVQNDPLLCDRIIADGRHCLLQMDRVKFTDSTGLGWLLRLQKKIRATQRELILIAPRWALKRDLSLLHLKEFFACVPNFASAQQLIENLARENGRLVHCDLREESNYPSRGRREESLTFSAPKHQIRDSSRRLLLGHDKVLSWRGEIVAANAASVWQETERLMLNRSNPLEPVDIDLSEVRFMDSSGVGLMVRTQKLARKQGIKLFFVGPQPAVQNVLRLSGLETFLLGEPA